VEISYNWLKKYVQIDVEAQELADRLTMAGIPVESFRNLGEGIEKVVVGEILEIVPHPNADKLIICKVDVGNEQLQIVTGADNVRVGHRVPVALHGSSLPGGVKIKKGKLRGEVSEGMLCSAKELALDLNALMPKQKEGIFILSPDAPVGVDIKEALGLDDVLFELELTANRADCFSHIGVAREVAAIYGKELRYPEIRYTEGKEKAENAVKINILAEENCYDYIGIVIKGVKIGPSPLWLQNCLRNVGVRSINNIADITNFVMFELGQPLHAFDLDEIGGREINVRMASPKERIVTLDEKERELSEEMMVIADRKNPVAIAGVMGGLDSEVKDKTKNVLIESAWFNGANVRKTALNLALRSEASTRFEKGVDPAGLLRAAQRAAALIQEIAGGEVLAGCARAQVVEEKPKVLTIDAGKLNGFLGTNLPLEKIVEILESLRFEVAVGDKVKVIIPTYRRDISHWEDIAEEVARMFGYDNIPETLPTGAITRGTQSLRARWGDQLKELLTNAGMAEIITYSFINPNCWDKLNLPEDHPWRKNVSLYNPLSEEYSVMRPTLIPSLLNVIAYNINRQNRKVGIFEIASVFLPKEDGAPLPEEKMVLTGALTSDEEESWVSKGDGLFYKAKGIMETVFEKMGIKEYSFVPHEHPSYHPGRTAVVVCEGKEVAIIGEQHPFVREQFDVGQRVVSFEIMIEELLPMSNTNIRYRPLPKFPAVVRDIAILVEDEVLSDTILQLIRDNGGEIVKDVSLFDVYKGKQIPAGYKSMAYSVVFQASDRTLTDEEVEEVMEKIKQELSLKINATLRS
jgi:phenylalanyl-tRNA synthetase beta chain